MARIVVTGGAGYIGAHVCKALAGAGFTPIVLDNFATGHRWAVRWGPLVETDLADRSAVEALLVRERPVAVIHLAASIEVGESVRNPQKYYRNNIANSLNLLEAMVAANVGVLVFSSTGATYGIVDRIPIPEDHLQQPINPYGETKLVIERAIRWFGSAHGLKWTSLRYFNAAGADPEGEIGEGHEPEIHLVPLVLGACLGQRPPVTIYGGDYPTIDGTAVRDYVHVSDLATAHLLAVRRLLDGGDGLDLNLGTGTGYSVRQLLDEAGRVTGVAPPAVLGARRPGDPPALVADSSRARRILDWTPRLSDLRTILDTAYRWHRDGPTHGQATR
jgi:UDP-glucose-4-epimerase GalE